MTGCYTGFRAHVLLDLNDGTRMSGFVLPSHSIKYFLYISAYTRVVVEKPTALIIFEEALCAIFRHVVPLD